PAPERARRPRLVDVHLVLPRARPPLTVARESIDAPFAERDHARLGARGLGSETPREVGAGGLRSPRRRVVWPVTLPASWVASTKPEAAIVRRQGWQPGQGRAWTLAQRDRGPGSMATLPV